MGFDSDRGDHSLSGPEECLESSSKEPQKKTYGKQVTLSKFAGPPSMKIDTQCLMELQNGEVLSPREAQRCIYKFPVPSAPSHPLSPASKYRSGRLDIAAHEPNVISSVVTTLHCIDFEGELWNDLLTRNEDIVRQAIIEDIKSVLRFFPAEAAVEIMPMYTGFVARCQVTHIMDISQDYINQCLSTFHFPVTRKLYQDLLLDCKLHALPAHARSISAVESEPASLCESVLFGSQRSLIGPDQCISPFGETMTSPEEEGREATRSTHVLQHVLLPRSPNSSHSMSLSEKVPDIERSTLIRFGHELRDPARSMSAVESQSASVREAALFGSKWSLTSANQYPSAARERLTSPEEEEEERETARSANVLPHVLLPRSPNASQSASLCEKVPDIERSTLIRFGHELRDPARSMSAVESQPASVREAALFGSKWSLTSANQYPSAARERLTSPKEEEERETARSANVLQQVLLPRSPNSSHSMSLSEKVPDIERSTLIRFGHELRDPARSMSAVESQSASVREAALFGSKWSLTSANQYPSAARERLTSPKEEEERETARSANVLQHVLLPRSPNSSHSMSLSEKVPDIERSTLIRFGHELRDPARSMSAVESQSASVREAALFGSKWSLTSANQYPSAARERLTSPKEEEERETARSANVLPHVLLPRSPNSSHSMSLCELAPTMERSTLIRFGHELRDPARSMSAVESQPASVREAALFDVDRSLASADQRPAADREKLAATEEERGTARRAVAPHDMLPPTGPDAPYKVSSIEMAPDMDRSASARSAHELRDPARSMSAVESQPASVREAALFDVDRNLASADQRPAADREKLAATEEERETARRAVASHDMLPPVGPDAPYKVSFIEMAPDMDRSASARSAHELRDPARSMSAVESQPASVREAALFDVDRSLTSADQRPAADREKLAATEEERETARRAVASHDMLPPVGPDAPYKVSFIEMAPDMDRSASARSAHELRDPARSMSAVESQPASVREAALFDVDRNLASVDQRLAADREKLAATEEERETARRAVASHDMLPPVGPDAPYKVSSIEMAPDMDRSASARSAHELRDPARSMSAVESQPASVREAALFDVDRNLASVDQRLAADREKLAATEEERETARRAVASHDMLPPVGPDAPYKVSSIEMAPDMDRSASARSAHELRDPARSMSAVESQPASVREAALFDVDRSLASADQRPAADREKLAATEEERGTARRAVASHDMLPPVGPDAPYKVSSIEMAPDMDRSASARSAHELRDPARSMSAVESQPASVREAALFDVDRSLTSADQRPAADREKLAATEEERETARRAVASHDMLPPVGPDAPYKVSSIEMAPDMDRSASARSAHELRDPARSMSAVESQPASVREAALFDVDRSLASADQRLAADREKLAATEEERGTARRAVAPHDMLPPTGPDAPYKVSSIEMAPDMDRSASARSAHELRDPARSMSAVESQPASVREAALFDVDRNLASVDQRLAADTEKLAATEEERETARRAVASHDMLPPVGPDAPYKVSSSEMAPDMDRSASARSAHELRDPARSMSAVESQPASMREAALFDVDRSLASADQRPAADREKLAATEEERETARRAVAPHDMLPPTGPDAPYKVSFIEMAPDMDRSASARSAHELRDPARSMSAVESQPASVREAALFDVDRSLASADQRPAADREKLAATEEERGTARRAVAPHDMLPPTGPDAPYKVSSIEMAPDMDRSASARSAHELRDPAHSMSAVESQPASMREAALFDVDRSLASADQRLAADREKLAATEEERGTARRAVAPHDMLPPVGPDAPYKVSSSEMAPDMDRSASARSAHELRDPARSMSAVESQPASVREAALFGADRSLASADQRPAADREKLAATEKGRGTARRAVAPHDMLPPVGPDAPYKVSSIEMAPDMDRSASARSAHELRDPARSMSAVESQPASVREAALFDVDRSLASADQRLAADREKLAATEEERGTARRAVAPHDMLPPTGPDAPYKVSSSEMAPDMDRSASARSAHELRDPARSMSAVESQPASMREAALFDVDRSLASADQRPAADREKLAATEEERETARRAVAPHDMLPPTGPDAPYKVSSSEMAPDMDRSASARSAHELRDPARSMSAVESQPASMREAALFDVDRSLASADQRPAADREKLAATEEERETARRAVAPHDMLPPVGPDAPYKVSFIEMAPDMDRSASARSAHELRDPARSMSPVESQPASMREAALFDVDRSLASADQRPAADREKLAATEKGRGTARRAVAPHDMLPPVGPDAPYKVSSSEMAPDMDRSASARSAHELRDPARSMSAVESQPASMREAALFGADRSLASADQRPAADREKLAATEKGRGTARRAVAPHDMLPPVGPDAPYKVSSSEMAPDMDRSARARSAHELRDPAHSMSAVESQPASMREAALFGADRSLASADQRPAAAREKLAATEKGRGTARRAVAPHDMLPPTGPDAPYKVSSIEMAPDMDRSASARSAHELRDPARSMSAVESQPASMREAALFGADRSLASADQRPAADREKLAATEKGRGTARRAVAPHDMLPPVGPDAPYKVSSSEMAPDMDRSARARSAHELRDPAHSMSAVESQPASMREAALFGADRSLASADQRPAAAREKLAATEKGRGTARRAVAPHDMLPPVGPDAPYKVSSSEMAPDMDRSASARSAHELRDPAHSMSAVESQPASMREAALFGADRSLASADQRPAADREKLAATEKGRGTARRAVAPHDMLPPTGPDAPYKVSSIEMAPDMDRSASARSAHELRDPAHSMSAVESQPASMREAALFGADRSLASADQRPAADREKLAATEKGRGTARRAVASHDMLPPTGPDAPYKVSSSEMAPDMDRSASARSAHELRDPARSMSAVESQPASMREAALFGADRSLASADQRPAAAREKLAATEKGRGTARRAVAPHDVLSPVGPDAPHKGSAFPSFAGVDREAPLISEGLVKTGDGEGLFNVWPQSGVDGTYCDESINASDGARRVPALSEVLDRFARISEDVADAAEKLVGASRTIDELSGLLGFPQGVEKKLLRVGMDKNIPNNESATRRDVSNNVASGDSVPETYPGYSPVDAAQRLESADAKLPFEEEYYPESDVRVFPALQSIRGGDEQRVADGARFVEPDKLNRGAKAHPSYASSFPETREVTAPSERLPWTKIKDPQSLDYMQPISDSAPGEALLSPPTVIGGSMVPDVEPGEKVDLPATLDPNLLLDVPKWQPSNDVDFSAVENPTERWLSFGSLGGYHEVPRRVLKESQRGRGHMQLMNNGPDLDDWAQECFDKTRVEEVAPREGYCSPMSLDAGKLYEMPKIRPPQSKVRAVATVTTAREASEANKKARRLPERVPVRAEPRKGRKPNRPAGMYDIEIFEMSVSKASDGNEDGQVFEVDVVCRKSLSDLLRDLERARHALRKPVNVLQGYRDEGQRCIQ